MEVLLKLKAKNNIGHYIKSKNFIVSLVIILLFSSFIVAAMNGRDLFYSFLICLETPWYIIFLLIVGLINTGKMLNEIRVDYNYLGRFKNKIYAYRNFIKVSTIINTILFVVSFLMLFFILVFYRNLPITNINYQYYDVKNYVYLVFHIIKVLFLLNLIQNVYIVLSLIIGSKVSTFLYSLILLDITFIPSNFGTVTSFLNMRFRPIYYFDPLPYSSFLLEVSISIFYIALLVILYYVLIYVFKKMKKDIV